MKNQTIVILLAILFPVFFYSQDTALLDEKRGFKDIKIGQSLASVNAKLTEDKKAKNHYNVENTEQYEIDNNKINNIVIKVSDKDSDTIEAFSMLFKPKQELDMENKSYDFYYELFREAFGEPSSKEKDVNTWSGEKIKLTTQKIAGFGIVNFEKILSQNEKMEQAKNASSKF